MGSLHWTLPILVPSIILKKKKKAILFYSTWSNIEYMVTMVHNNHGSNHWNSCFHEYI